MKKIKILTIALLATGLFLGCSKKDAKTGAQAVENYTRDNDLQGKFLGNCEASGLVGTFSRTALVFDGAKLKMEKAFFAEADCSKDEVGRAIYQSVFKLDDEKQQGNDVKTIEIAVDKAQVEIRSETLAAVASGVNYCGVSSYQAGKIYDVTPNTKLDNCFVTVVPVTYYGTYRLSKGDAGLYLNLSAPEVSKLATVKADRNYAVEANPATGYTKTN
jgi:hypothetical protein